jgi:hypothetical protein
VPGDWGSAIPTAVFTAVSTGPTIVLAGILVRARWVGSVAVAVVAVGAGTCLGKLFGKCGDNSKRGDELAVCRGQVLGERRIGLGEICDGLAIFGGGCGQICYGFNGFVLFVAYFGLKRTRRPRGDLQSFVVFLIGHRKIQFELWPSFIRWSVSFPNFAIVGENSSSKNQLVGDAEDLLGRVRRLPSGGEFNGVLTSGEPILQLVLYFCAMMHRIRYVWTNYSYF